MQRFRSLLAASVVTLILSACQDASAPITSVPAPVPSAVRDELANSHVYIVGFRNNIIDAATTARVLAAKYGGRVKHVYPTLNGMAIEIPDVAVAALRAEPGIVTVEPDGTFTLNETQANPPWGLDRIDQRTLPLSNTYTYAVNGTGVTVYIIDTGIDPSNTDFGGRASVGFDATGGNGIDCLGHGTHVAGTVGGSTYGVAKNVQLVGIKVTPNCDDEGQVSDLIAGIDWVTANRTGLSVANISMGAAKHFWLNYAVATSIGSGVTYAVSAGNCDTDWLGNCVYGPHNACDRSPSSVTTAIVVAATNSSDQHAYFSNHGSCVSLHAPGVGIPSTGLNGANPVFMSGTSMASPHAAGVAAQYLSQNPYHSPANVRSALINNATQGAISGIPHPETPNRLLFTEFAPNLLVTIEGPTTVRPNVECHWFASVSGGTPPYTYEWIMGSVFSEPQSYGPEVYYTNEGNGFMTRVRVRDAAGQVLFPGFMVSVSPDAPEC